MPVPAVIVSVTLPVKLVAVRPAASCAVTCTAGLMVAPAAVPVGCTVKTNWFGCAAVISKGALAAPVRPAAVADSVYPTPARSMRRVGKAATPPTAATVVVPERLPPAGLLPIATVTLPAKPSALLPKASRAVTSIWGVMVVPAAAGLGCTVNAS